MSNPRRHRPFRDAVAAAQRDTLVRALDDVRSFLDAPLPIPRRWVLRAGLSRSFIRKWSRLMDAPANLITAAQDARFRYVLEASDRGTPSALR